MDSGEFVTKNVDRKLTYITGLSNLNINIPKEARTQGITGKTIIEFEIDEFGKTSNFKIKQARMKHSQ